MLVDNLYNSWADNTINDYWINNKIVDCSSIHKIYNINTKTCTSNYIKSYTKSSSIQSCTSNYIKPYTKSYSMQNYTKSNNKLYTNINTINSINIKKLNNNNYANKSIYNHGNHSKDKNIKR
jgi:hypothetical protein